MRGRSAILWDAQVGITTGSRGSDVRGRESGWRVERGWNFGRGSVFTVVSPDVSTAALTCLTHTSDKAKWLACMIRLIPCMYIVLASGWSSPPLRARQNQQHCLHHIRTRRLSEQFETFMTLCKYQGRRHAPWHMLLYVFVLRQAP